MLTMSHLYQKSYECFKWAENWDPLKVQYAFNLGNALNHLGQYQEAMDWYQKATF